MWTAAIDPQADRENSLAALRPHFDISSQRLAQDYDTFVDGLLTDNILVRCETPKMPARVAGADRRMVSAPTWNAWDCLCRTVGSLRIRGLASTYDRYARLGARRPAADNRNLPAMLAAFSYAENFMTLKRAPRDCLPRSLALFRFLRRRGYPSRHFIGVDTDPFAAHAWVELDGDVISDADWRASYAVIAAMGE
jgi:hypothetical protein